MIMRSKLLLSSALAVLVAFSVPKMASAADHRDSPTVDEDIATDINDIFMFRDPADSTKLVMVMSTHGLSSPRFSTTYHYQPNALYRLNFGHQDDGIPLHEIDFVFSPFAGGKQTFTAYFPHHTLVQGNVTLATVTPTPAAPIINEGPSGSGIEIFAGPRDDPFVFDLVGFNRFVAGTGTFSGTDAFAGFNINAIVIKFPIALVSDGASKFAAWGVTYGTKGPPQPDGIRFGPGPGEFHFSSRLLSQIDRMGNPAVNTALIPAPLKDAYNFGIPQNDAKDFGPTILATLKHFNTPAANVSILASVAIPDTLKYDTTKADGFPNGRKLTDRPIDTLLTLILGSPTTDGTKGNDATFLTSFPYLAPPHQPQ